MQNLLTAADLPEAGARLIIILSGPSVATGLLLLVLTLLVA